ncbi:MAG: lytic transglycosylase domain-containing protein [Alphaproteobacteria bacterium]
MFRRVGLLLVAVVATAAAGGAAASPSALMCLEAIRSVEARRPSLPEGLLHAIALTESAYRPDDMATAVPWPWTINSPEGSFYLDSRREAVAKVEELQAMGVRNIDVGCMQVNLHFHPDAFHSLDDAFHPASNVGYAARFLRDLESATPTLFDAVGRYHSGTPWRSRAYARKVFARWGKDGDIAPPSKHGLGRPDSPRLVDREDDARQTTTGAGGSGPWQRVYGTTSASSTSSTSSTDVLGASGTGSWLRRDERDERDEREVPGGAGQIRFR